MNASQFPGQTLQPLPASASGSAVGDDEFSLLQKAVQLLYNLSTSVVPPPATPDLEAVLTAGNDGGGLAITNIGSLGLRDPSAAFDVTLRSTSSVTLTAGKFLDFDVANADQILKFTGASVATVPLGTNTLFGSKVVNTQTIDAIGAAVSVGQTLQNTTAAATGAATQQWSPALEFIGQVWDATGGDSDPVSSRLYVVPFEGGTGRGYLTLKHYVDGAAIDQGTVEFGSYNDIWIGSTSGAPGGTVASGIYIGSIKSDNTPALALSGSGGLILSSNMAVRWVSTFNANDTPDLNLFRDAAEILALKSFAVNNPHSLRVYGHFTNSTNYLRAALNTTSTTVVLAAETLGTGADNIDIGVTTAGTGLVDFTNQAFAADAAVASTHTFRMKVGGVEKKVLCATP